MEGLGFILVIITFTVVMFFLLLVNLAICLYLDTDRSLTDLVKELLTSNISYSNIYNIILTIIYIIAMLASVYFFYYNHGDLLP